MTRVCEGGGILPEQNSAQAVEIIELTRACELTKGKRATIYTNSKYAYGEIYHSILRTDLG